MPHKPIRSILIGNGVNQLDGGPKWEELMNRLTTAAGVDSELVSGLEHKPFPLVYETILNAFDDKKMGKREPDLKKLVAETLQNLCSNEYHRRLARLPIDEILTTNYDYGFEKALTDGSGERRPPKRETKYSVFRNRKAGKMRIWHIHGELEQPWSICLGTDHYTGYVAAIRELLLARGRVAEEGDQDRERTLGIVAKGLLRLWQTGTIESWIDCFFTGRMDIVGFGADYTEMDFWWLLNIRARQSRNIGLPLGDITFHCLKPARNEHREVARLQVLENLCVTVKRYPIRGSDRHRLLYDEFIKNYPG